MATWRWRIYFTMVWVISQLRGVSNHSSTVILNNHPGMNLNPPHPPNPPCLLSSPVWCAGPGTMTLGLWETSVWIRFYHQKQNGYHMASHQHQHANKKMRFDRPKLGFHASWTSYNWDDPKMGPWSVAMSTRKWSPQVGIAVPILKTNPYEVTHGETSQTALTKCICNEIWKVCLCQGTDLTWRTKSKYGKNTILALIRWDDSLDPSGKHHARNSPGTFFPIHCWFIGWSVMVCDGLWFWVYTIERLMTP